MTALITFSGFTLLPIRQAKVSGGEEKLRVRNSASGANTYIGSSFIQLSLLEQRLSEAAACPSGQTLVEVKGSRQEWVRQRHIHRQEDNEREKSSGFKSSGRSISNFLLWRWLISRNRAVSLWDACWHAHLWVCVWVCHWRESFVYRLFRSPCKKENGFIIFLLMEKWAEWDTTSF